MEPTPRRQINLQNQVSANGAYGTKNSVNLREHVPLLSGCTLSVFSWVVNRWRWKKTFVQPPSAPQWIMDLILALIDRFGDKENELSWHLELSTFPKAQSRFTKEITGFQVAMALMYEQMLNMSRIIMCKGNAYQFSTDRPYKKMMSRYFFLNISYSFSVYLWLIVVIKVCDVNQKMQKTNTQGWKAKIFRSVIETQWAAQRCFGRIIAISWISFISIPSGIRR